MEMRATQSKVDGGAAEAKAIYVISPNNFASLLPYQERKGE
jgi:hypothetical protein